jgi:hypothetical protein
MTLVGFEPRIPAFERAKIVYAFKPNSHCARQDMRSGPESEDMEWILLALDTIQCRTRVNRLMNLGFHRSRGIS